MFMQCLVVVLSCLAISVHSASTTPPTALKCRICDRSPSLDSCTKLSVCSDQEDCYMDELITEQLTIVYNGGCRAKDVCSSSASAVHLGKRDDLVACSRCCNNEEDCNKRLCGIKSSNINATQCYSCDARDAAQAQVKHPEDCVSLGTCQSDEMCYAYRTTVAGENEFYFGCQKKLICKLLMREVFRDLDECITNWDDEKCGLLDYASTTATPGGGSSSAPIGRRAEIVQAHETRNGALCHSCCGDGGCNFGGCLEMNQRLWNLKKASLLNLDTLKANSTGTPAGRR